MKRIVVLIFAVIINILINTQIARSQVFVKVRPMAPVHVAVRGVAPSPFHVWVEPEWRWRRHEYVYIEGHWARPHRHQIWIPGHWIDTPEGSKWIHGYWGRR